MSSRRTAAAALAAMTAIGLAGCGSDDPGPREGVRVEEITGDASGGFDLDDVEAGQRVSLRVEIAEVLSSDSFVVAAKDTAGDPLLVLARDHDAAPGDVLQVAGIARVFSYEEQARGHDLADAAAYEEHDGGLALVARLVDRDLPLDDQ